MISALTYEYIPKVLGHGWTQVNTPSVADGAATYVHSRGIAVIVSAEKISNPSSDGIETWVHVSVSRRDQQLPSFGELFEVKELFIGRDKLAIQVFPSSEEYVNINPGVLHLWYCPDRRIVPDLRTIGGQI